MSRSRLCRWCFAVLTLALAVSPVLLTGCETVKGAGRDIQNAGQAGSDAIDGAAGKK